MRSVHLLCVALTLLFCGAEAAKYHYNSHSAKLISVPTNTQANLWTDPNWYIAGSRVPTKSIPGPLDDVYIDDVGCATGVIYLDVPTRIASLTIGVNQSSFHFVLILDAELTVSNQVIVSPGSELRMGVDSTIHCSNLVVSPGASLTGNGTIDASNSQIGGYVNPYNEPGLRKESVTADPALYIGNFEFTGNVVLAATSVAMMDIVAEEYDFITVDGDFTIMNGSILAYTSHFSESFYAPFVYVNRSSINAGHFNRLDEVSTSLYFGVESINSSCQSSVPWGIVVSCAQQSKAGVGKRAPTGGLGTCTAYDSGNFSIYYPPSNQPAHAAPICSIGYGVLTGSSICHCAPGYSGSSCATYSCSSSQLDCSGAGYCYGDYTNAPFCVCNSNYSGSLCQYASCPGNGNCNLNGRCIATGGQTPYCNCSAGWTGPGCSTGFCAKGCGHGTCDTSYATPKCICDADYSGSDCSIVNKTCSTQCSSHGSCNSTSGLCSCAGGWTGPSCSALDCGQDCGAGKCSALSNGTNACSCSNGVVPWNLQCKAATQAPTTSVPTTVSPTTPAITTPVASTAAATTTVTKTLPTTVLTTTAQPTTILPTTMQATTNTPSTPIPSTVISPSTTQLPSTVSPTTVVPTSTIPITSTIPVDSTVIATSTVRPTASPTTNGPPTTTTPTNTVTSTPTQTGSPSIVPTQQQNATATITVNVTPTVVPTSTPTASTSVPADTTAAPTTPAPSTGSPSTQVPSTAETPSTSTASTPTASTFAPTTSAPSTTEIPITDPTTTAAPSTNVSVTAPPLSCVHGYIEDNVCVCYNDRWSGVLCDRINCSECWANQTCYAVESEVYCETPIPTCAFDCGPHGVCQNSTCRCDENWFGQTCNNVECRDCSGHGHCLSSNYSCDCAEDYDLAADCSIQIGFNNCSNNCSGIAACLFDRASLKYSCNCPEPGIQNEDCSAKSDLWITGKAKVQPIPLIVGCVIGGFVVAVLAALAFVYRGNLKTFFQIRVMPKQIPS